MCFNRRNCQGFTLIEVIVCIVLLGLLGSAVFVGMTSMVQVYRAGMEQANRLPQVDAAINAICAGLRRGEDPDRLTEATASLPGIQSVSIRAVAGSENESDTSFSRLYEVMISYRLTSSSDTATRTFYVENHTGALLEHWGREYML